MVDLSEMLPSVDLVRVIAELDRAAVNSEERLDAIAACERVLSWMTALQNDLLVDADRDYDPTVFGFDAGSAARWYGEQVGMALGISGSAAQRRMNQAITLTEKLPNVTSALRVGAITVHHARVAAVNVNVLDTEIAQAVDAAVMTDTDWRTPSQLERAFRQTILALDPVGAAKRHEEAKRVGGPACGQSPTGCARTGRCCQPSKAKPSTRPWRRTPGPPRRPTPRVTVAPSTSAARTPSSTW